MGTRSIVIALTKADEYPKKWIPAARSGDVIPKVEAKFNEELSEAKDYLQFLFTMQ